MPTQNFFATAANNARRAASWAWVACLVGLAGCAAQPGATADVQPVAPKPLPLDAAVASLTDSLFNRARLDPGLAAKRTLVIDPLIDHETGSESKTTRSIADRITAAVRVNYPQIKQVPFTSENLEAQPLVLVGSITTEAGSGAGPTTIGAPPKAYRIWAVLADLKTNRVVSHETAWVVPDQVDASPTAFFRDSPAWLADPEMVAYLKTSDAKVGDPIDPSFVEGLQAEATLSDGIKAYEAAQYQDALKYYTEAEHLPRGNRLQLYNGLYLTSLALGRKQQAEQEFGQLVSYGLAQGKLGMKFVFVPSSTAFWPDPAISGLYPMWLRQIAYQTLRHRSCLRLVGHTSPTGIPALNAILSDARARAVRTRLVHDERPLARRIEASGVGSSEPLVGTGRDDATDLLDRRVDLDPYDCAAALQARLGVGAGYN